jgi:AcrR family transcriptional regulator
MDEGTPDAKESISTRDAIVLAAEKIMRDHGYGAVTSRRVAAEAGLKSQLVYYYFKTMDDLFLAVVRQAEERYFRRMAKALSTANPLRSIWELATDPSQAGLSVEFFALANHRESVRELLVRSTTRSAHLIEAAVAAAADSLSTENRPLSPVALSLLMTSLSFTLSLQSRLGVSTGHAEVQQFVAGLLDTLESNG